MAGIAVSRQESVQSEINHKNGTKHTTVLMEDIRVVSSDGTCTRGFATSSFSYRFIKRLIDFAVSGAALLILAPLLIFIAIAVRISSPGPVFYRERRVGRHGKHFTIYKFRSMHTKEYLQRVLRYQESEHARMQRRIEGKHLHDPRITKLGKILRKLSLDELPQLFNILLGDMSLVGPRPVVDAELAHYGDYAVFYKFVYPGLSGLWQVSGRNDISYQSRVQMDVVYCRKWSLLLDFVILVRTVPTVLQGKGAY